MRKRVELSIDCDVIVLGMGTCGEDAGLRLATAGLDVVGVEPNLIGGECPYWACLPTKSLVRSANLVIEARRADGLVGAVSVETEWATIASRIRTEITGGWDDTGGVRRFEVRGGRFVRGWGKVVGPRTVQVGSDTVAARLGVLVATGSTPLIPPIDGLEDTPFWTNREAVATETLPGSLVIVGGGPVGCELGQVFARFGTKVTIVEGSDRLLAHGEPEASAQIGEVFTDEGMDVITGVHVTSVKGDEDEVGLNLDDGSFLTAERLLLAVGRRGTADQLGLDRVGATVSHGFVDVDDKMRAADGLWAIGDVTGPPLLTQVAQYQGRIAVEDILGGSPRPADYSAMPAVTFTDPEVGSVGLTEEQARSQGRNVIVSTKRLEATFRGWLHRTGNAGFIKMVADIDEGCLVGATVVGPNAGEVLGFLHLAVAKQAPLEELVDLIYPFPTMYGGIGEALGAYGRGVVRVLDPDTAPMFDDPPITI